MKNETEDIVYRCKDCSKYNLCNYYYRRKETSQICHYFELNERNNNSDRVSRNDVISICNILADKMDDEGRVAVEQVRDAVKDMRTYPYQRTCRYCTISYDSEECYDCTNNFQGAKMEVDDVRKSD